MTRYRAVGAGTLLLLLAGLFGSCDAEAGAIVDIPGYSTITFHEVSGVALTFTIGKNDSRLTDRRLDFTGSDFFSAVPPELYDVFYSDADGTLNIVDGEYVTIEAVYGGTAAAGLGGALNIARVELNSSSGLLESGNVVASFLALGDNIVPGSESNAIDGSLAARG